MRRMPWTVSWMSIALVHPVGGEALRFGKVGAGLRCLSEVLQGTREFVVCLRVFGGKPQRFAELRDRSGVISGLNLLSADADSKRRGLRRRSFLVQPLRLGELFVRARLPGLLQRLTQSEVSLGRVRVVLNRLAQMNDRGVEISLLLQHCRSHVVRLGVRRLPRNSGLELAKSLFGFSRLPQQHAKRKRCFG